MPPPPPKKKLHNLCLSFLLGIAAVPREIENNAYAKFGGSGALWEMCKWRISKLQNSHFQNGAKCKDFPVKMSFICSRIKKQIHINSFALSLA